jgi:hypothetical protein
MATNPIRLYHLSKLPERQPRSDTFPESHRAQALAGITPPQRCAHAFHLPAAPTLLW